MNVHRPLSAQSEVVNERRRWTQDWYTWLSDLSSAVDQSTTSSTDPSVINAKDFGAVGDFVADDTATLQAAINAAFIVATSNTPDPPIGNKILYIPPGKYKITSPLQLTGTFGAVMYGAGRFTTQIVNSAGGNVFQTQGCQYNMFRDMLLQTSGSGICFNLDWDGINNCALQSNTFQNMFFSGGAYGVGIGFSGFMGSENTFINCFWLSNTTAGIFAANFNAACNEVFGGNFQGCGTGILVGAGSVTSIVGVSFQASVNWDISVTGSASDCYHVTGCRSESVNFANFARGCPIISGCTHAGVSNGAFVTNSGPHNLGLYNCISLLGQLSTFIGEVANCEFGRLDWASASTFCLVRSTYINGVADVGGGTFLFDGVWSGGEYGPIAEIVNSYNGVITVKDFGAVGDGVTDDTSAVQAAVNAAGTYGSAGNTLGIVLFPPGIYIIGSSACLTPSIGSITSIKYQGCGQSASILQFGTLSADTWFYDNGSTGNQTSFMSSFYDLGFRGSGSLSNFASIPTHAKGFRFVGNTAETSFRFYNCEFSGLNLCFSMEGTNLASDMNFFGCRFVTIQDFMVIANAQSFLHHFYGCEWEIYGEAFIIVNGGGSIATYGGSVICLASGPVTDQYFVDLFGNTAAFGGMPLVFSGTRFEFRGAYNNLVYVDDLMTGQINFSDCTFEDQSTTKPAWARIANQMVLTFTRCVFFDIFSTDPFRFQVNGSDTYGQTGSIFFDSCVVPVDLSSKCSLPTNHGSIRALNCTGTNVGAAAAQHWANDFTFHGNFVLGQASAWSTAGVRSGDGGGTDPRWVKHVAQIKLSSELWPTDQEPTLLLPASAIIVGIHIRKPPGGSSTTTQLQVTNNNKTVTHVQTNSANWSTTVLSADLTDYYYCVGTLTNDRTLRLSSTVSTSGSFVTGGFAIVEYY